MNIKHFTYNLLRRKKASGKSDMIISSLTGLRGSIKTDIETGGNYAVKDLLVYARAIDAILVYKSKDAAGNIEIVMGKPAVVEKKSRKVVKTFHSTAILDLLVECNKCNGKLSFVSASPSIYISDSNTYDDIDIWKEVEKINALIRNKVKDQHEKVASALHIPVSSLERFLWSVIDYDYRLIQLMLNSIDKQMLFRHGVGSHCYLEIENGKLFKIDSQKTEFGCIKGQKELICDIPSPHITDFVRSIQGMNFTPIIANNGSKSSVKDSAKVSAFIPEAWHSNDEEFLLRRKKKNVDDVVDVKKGHTRVVRDALKSRGSRIAKGVCSYCHSPFKVGWEYRTVNDKYINLCVPCKYKYSEGKINFKHMVIDVRM